MSLRRDEYLYLYDDTRRRKRLQLRLPLPPRLYAKIPLTHPSGPNVSSDVSTCCSKTRRARNTQRGVAADAANPRPFGSHAGVAPCTPFFGGMGMMPACPKSLATVSDGCAPTLSQYLRVGVGNGDGQGRSGSSGGNGGGLASPVPARRAHNPKSRGGTSLAVARARTHLARSIFSPMCLFPSISAAMEGERCRGSATGGGRRGPAVRRRGVATDTHQVSGRSAR